jgi:hypothetical protein
MPCWMISRPVIMRNRLSARGDHAASASIMTRPPKRLDQSSIGNVSRLGGKAHQGLNPMTFCGAAKE